MAHTSQNPAVSQAQYLLAQAVLSGTNRGGGMTAKVARELVDRTPARFRSLWSKRNGKTAPNPVGRIYIERVHIDRQGYEKDGTYWGVGQPLFYYESEDGSVEGHIRADDAKHARLKVIKKHPELKVEKLKKGNPAAAAEEMHEAFHGMPPKEVLEFDERVHVHSNLTGLGDLIGLKVRTMGGYDVELKFEAAEAGRQGNPKTDPWKTLTLKGTLYFVRADGRDGLKSMSTGQKVKVTWHTYLGSGSAYMRESGTDWTSTIKPDEGQRIFKSWPKEWVDWRTQNPGGGAVGKFLAAKAAGFRASGWHAHKTVDSVEQAYKIQDQLTKRGIESRVDQVRVRLFPTPKYKYEVMTGARAAQQVNPSDKWVLAWEKLYHDAQRADDVFQAALVAKYKGRAGDMRYRTQELPADIRKLRDAKVAADEKLREHTRAKNPKGVFKPALDFVGKGTEAIYRPTDEIFQKVAVGLDRGLRLNPYGEPVSRKGSSMWRASGGGEYPTKTEAIKAALSHGRERGLETVQIYRDGKAIIFNVTTGRPMYDMPHRSNPNAPTQFSGPAHLASNEKGTQLHILGGDQSLNLKAIKIEGPEAEKENVLVGEVWLLSYYTTKQFDGEEESYEYVHMLGPEERQSAFNKKLAAGKIKDGDLWEDAEPPEDLFGTGELPTLLYRPLEERLLFAGGVYHIEKPLLGTSPGIED